MTTALPRRPRPGSRGPAGENHDRPWVLFVGFVAPHFPLTLPKDILDLYPVAKMPPPRLHPKDGHPRHPWLEACHRMHPVDDALDEQQAPPGDRLLLRSVHVGRSPGRPRHRALERSGLAETTRVVYTSDHGDNIGARGMWGKSTHYDDAVGVPMIISGPDVAAGQVCRTPVSLVDLAPTIMAGSRRGPRRLGERISRDGRSSISQTRPIMRSAPSSPNTMHSPARRRRSCFATDATNTTTMSATGRSFRSLGRPRGRTQPRRPTRSRCGCGRHGGAASPPARPRGHRRTRQGRPGRLDQPLRWAGQSHQRRSPGSYAGTDLKAARGAI